MHGCIHHIKVINAEHVTAYALGRQKLNLLIHPVSFFNTNLQLMYSQTYIRMKLIKEIET